MVFSLAVGIAIVGLVLLLQGQLIFGIVLLMIGCLVAPAGHSLFDDGALDDPDSGGAP